MIIIPDATRSFHFQQAGIARELYVASLTPESRSSDWKEALKQARATISSALRASRGLSDIPAGLQDSGAHMLVFRNLLAPPTSQDQFKLICPDWPKTSEKTCRPLKHERALSVASCILAMRDKRLTRWLDRNRGPSKLELRNILAAVGPIIANQIVATVQRNRYAAAQELSVIDLLIAKGWTKVPRNVVRQGATISPRHFMHKAMFATSASSKSPHEVDIACGLRNTVVLAMECKVTNDETNSIKRISELLNKANSWQSHWGSFVRTGALLQGVIGPKDVYRLLAKNVEVFWSHDLEKFSEWLDANV